MAQFLIIKIRNFLTVKISKVMKWIYCIFKNLLNTKILYIYFFYIFWSFIFSIIFVCHVYPFSLHVCVNTVYRSYVFSEYGERRLSIQCPYVVCVQYRYTGMYIVHKYQTCFTLLLRAWKRLIQPVGKQSIFTT